MKYFKRLFSIIVLIILVSIIFQENLKGQQTNDNQNPIFVFVVDQSLSMRDDNLHIKVKRALEEYVRKEIKLGSRLILMGFGDEIRYPWDAEINTIKDKERIYHIISLMEFNDKWTHMSAAFDHLYRRLIELRAKYPTIPIYIYIFTDGRNDPPPELGESPELFAEILDNYFVDIIERNWFIFYITFGISPPQEIIDKEEEEEGFEIDSLPRKPIGPVFPLRVRLRFERDTFNIAIGEDRRIVLPFEVISITRNAVVIAKVGQKDTTLNLTTSSRSFKIPYIPEKIGVQMRRDVINFSLAEEGEIIPSQFEFFYRLTQIKIDLRLKKDKFEFKKGKIEAIALPFEITYINGDAKVKAIFPKKDTIFSLSKESKEFALNYQPTDTTVGRNTISLNFELMGEAGEISPEQFNFVYEITVVNWLRRGIIIGAIIILFALIAYIYMKPSFAGEIVFVDEDISRPLKGKFCKQLKSIKKGIGISSKVKICPYSRGMARIVLPKGLKAKKNGVEVKRKSIILSSEDEFEISDKRFKYIRKTKRRM